MTNTNPKVSVIVPIYNVEAFIERCAVSLFEQTLDDIEYIFVNDCTPDNSMTILSAVLERYPQRKEQVRIINQPKNLGAAKAREDGIKVARGKYIIHCDSDDWVDKNMYQLLYEKATTNKFDMLICDWYVSDGVNHKVVTQNLDVNSDLLRGLLNQTIVGSLWNKFVACHIYHSLDFFPTAHMWEDVAYTVQFMHKCANIGYLGSPLYYYYNNENSICRSKDEASSIKRCMQACENIDAILQYLKKYNLDKRYANDIVVLKNSARVGLWHLFLKQPKKYYRKWLSVYPEINLRYPLTSGIPFTYRLVFGLSVIGVYPLIYKIMHRR